MNSLGTKTLLGRKLLHKHVHSLLKKEHTYVTCGCGHVLQTSLYGDKNQRLLLSELPGQGHYDQRRQFSVEQFREWRISFMTKHFGEHVLPVKWLTESLNMVHETTGLPWWGTICVTTVVFKSMLTLPLSIIATKNRNRLLLLNPELQERMKSLRDEVEVFGYRTGYSEPKKKIIFYKHQKIVKRKFYVEKNVHPMKSFAAIFTQLPLWVYLSFALRHLSGGFLMGDVDSKENLFDYIIILIRTLEANNSVKLLIYFSVRVVKAPDMLTEGALWFTDLTVPDPFLLLPILMCGINLLNIQLMVWDAKRQGMKPAPIGRIFVGLGRLYSVLMIPIGTLVPSAMVLYWTVSAMFALIQNIALRNERVMLAFGIPVLPKKPPSPIGDSSESSFTNSQSHTENKTTRLNDKRNKGSKKRKSSR